MSLKVTSKKNKQNKNNKTRRQPNSRPVPCNPNIQPEQPQQEDEEMHQVNLGELGNYFDVVRNNYFEANRVIFIIGPITWETGLSVIQKLCFYDDGTKSPITIYISSPGGECDVGFAIIDCINSLKKKGIEVNTICIGSCSSMASIILCAGTIGKRFAFPSSRIMIHQAGVVDAGGNLTDIQIIHQELQIWTDNMNKIFKQQTGKSLDELKALTAYDNYMSAAEAKKLGLIDKIAAKMI